MIELITISLSAVAVGYAFLLKRNEERRQARRQASRAVWISAK